MERRSERPEGGRKGQGKVRGMHGDHSRMINTHNSNAKTRGRTMRGVKRDGEPPPKVGVFFSPRSRAVNTRAEDGIWIYVVGRRRRRTGQRVSYVRGKSRNFLEPKRGRPSELPRNRLSLLSPPRITPHVYFLFSFLFLLPSTTNSMSRGRGGGRGGRGGARGGQKGA